MCSEQAEPPEVWEVQGAQQCVASRAVSQGMPRYWLNHLEMKYFRVCLALPSFSLVSADVFGGLSVIVLKVPVLSSAEFLAQQSL